jgi:hypothetical protein
MHGDIASERIGRISQAIISAKKNRAKPGFFYNNFVKMEVGLAAHPVLTLLEHTHDLVDHFLPGAAFILNQVTTGIGVLVE